MKKGFHHTEESKKKNALSHIGKTPWNKGKKGLQKSKYKGMKLPWVGHNKPHSEATKRKVSEAKKKNPTRYWLGKIHSKIHRKKLHDSRWGIGYVRKTKPTDRYYRIKENGGNFNKEEWEHIKRIFCYTCMNCGKKEPKIKLTIDHIRPISKGGRHEIGNIQPLCKKCNCLKAASYNGILWDTE